MKTFTKLGWFLFSLCLFLFLRGATESRDLHYVRKAQYMTFLAPRRGPPSCQSCFQKLICANINSKMISRRHPRNLKNAALVQARCELCNHQSFSYRRPTRLPTWFPGGPRRASGRLPNQMIEIGLNDSPGPSPRRSCYGAWGDKFMRCFDVGGRRSFRCSGHDGVAH